MKNAIGAPKKVKYLKIPKLHNFFRCLVVIFPVSVKNEINFFLG